LLATIRWGWGEAASHGGQAPFLDVALDEDESHLAKVYMDGARSVGTYGREEVLRTIIMSHVLEFLAVASKEDGAGSGSISNTYHIAL
jgi:hypothetical protein